MQFRVSHLIKLCPPDTSSLIGQRKYRQDSHGGRTECPLALFIAHHAALFNGFEGITSGIFNEFGSGDGTPSIVIRATSPTITRSIMIEADEERVRRTRTWLELMGTHLSAHSFELYHQSYLHPWSFYDSLVESPIAAYYFNNFSTGMSPKTLNKLSSLVDRHSSVGSVMICFGVMFFHEPRWTLERFEVVDLPRGDCSWLCRESSPDIIFDRAFTVYKYRKGEEAPLLRSSARLIPKNVTTISYSDFWKQHEIV